jgi:hypothetical protein
MTNKLEDFENEESLIAAPLDTNKIKDKLPTYSSEKLCEMIVCDRYFGCYKDVAIMCMEELANRRIAGDPFSFETYIENSLKDMPVIDLSIPDLGDVLRQLTGKKIIK